MTSRLSRARPRIRCQLSRTGHAVEEGLDEGRFDGVGQRKGRGLAGRRQITPTVRPPRDELLNCLTDEVAEEGGSEDGCSEVGFRVSGDVFRGGSGIIFT